jgi:predicted membrane channel-forming protein YqfA (hemolysin III family)
MKNKNKKKFIEVLKKILKIIGYILGAILTIALLFLIYINLPVKQVSDSARIGVTFSSRYAGDIGLDWKQAYIAMLD